MSDSEGECCWIVLLALADSSKREGSSSPLEGVRPPGLGPRFMDRQTEDHGGKAWPVFV